MDRKFFKFGIFFAALSVLLGAFGAHALKKLIPLESVAVFETGVRYQFIHALALILLNLYAQQNKAKSTWINWSGYAFMIGIILFSGSLYFISLSSVFIYLPWLGPITPLGGLFFIIGWISWGREVFNRG